MSGWIKLRRSSQENPLYFAEPFTRRQAWQDLILIASHKDGHFYIRGNKIEVKRGQLARGERDLSARRKWSRDKTRKYLNDLEKMQQIIQQKNRICSIYTIVNYDLYQTTDQTTEKPQTRPQKNQYKKNKKKEEGQEETRGIDFLVEQVLEDKQLREDFVEMRNKLKKPMTDKAQILILNKLNKYGPTERKLMLEKSIANARQDVYELKPEDKPKVGMMQLTPEEIELRTTKRF